MTTTRSKMLICVDPSANSNKFYEVTLDANGAVHTRYGRVGEPGKAGVGGRGESDFHRIVRSKTAKGYVEARVVSVERSTAVDKAKAHSDLAGKSNDPRLTRLIDRIVQLNAHQIADMSGGRITVQNGQVTTPLGLLTEEAIADAAELLDRLENDQANKRLLGQYLTLVPQSVGRSRDWTDSFFSGRRTVQQQRDFLDQLQQSVALSRKTSITAAKKDRVLAYTLSPVDDSAVVEKIRETFDATRNVMHGSSSMKLTAVFAVTNPAGDEVFDASARDLGNVRRLWHGTRTHNVLSILATGLIVPPRSGSSIQIAGRMFGNGLYFSEQSTKSLNYSRGGVWSAGRDDRALMFLADVAMGWEYHPGRHPSAAYDSVLAGKVTDPKHGKVFNSINVKAGTGGVRNHEAVVPGPERVALRYMCEFEA